MPINFDNALGLFPQTLALREKRAEVLAANLANADTPNYKARDLEFQSVLKQAISGPVSLETTNPVHLPPRTELLDGHVMYRVPTQASLDGNTVETHVEQAKFMENALQYQASLRFVNGRIAGLLTALRGE